MLFGPIALLCGGAQQRESGDQMARDLVTLACTECKRRNYTTKKNKTLTPARLEMKKFCRFEQLHTLHREIK